MRLDCELVERNIFKTRTKAKAEILNGNVICNGKVVKKPSYEVVLGDMIEISGNTLKYVSRGGLKLEKAISKFNLKLHKKVMIDIGSSTGGFSDCAIQNGIDEVIAIDVGKDQFDEELRKNPKIKLYERTDFRDMPLELVEKADVATIDVSFISITKLIHKLSMILNLNEIICLIKPQFECGKEIATKYKGIINNKSIHIEVIERIIYSFYDIEYKLENLTYSPIVGGDGNIEYLAYFKKMQVTKDESIIEISDVVNEAFAELKVVR